VQGVYVIKKVTRKIPIGHEDNPIGYLSVKVHFIRAHRRWEKGSIETKKRSNKRRQVKGIE